VNVFMTQVEAEPDAASPKKAQQHWRKKDAQGFSTAGRELTDDELDGIVGGLQPLPDGLQ
jgi:hypothetical protein